jgi:hypothetical protein
MKKLVLILAALVVVSAFADEYVQGYVRRDGTYVQPHFRSAPDSNPFNNYSTQGNTNPYTGQTGTVNPYQQPQPVYQMPQPYQGQSSYRPPVCGIVNGQYVCR